MKNNTWITKFIIFVFLLSTFSSSALVVPTGHAEGDNDELKYVDGEYELPVNVLESGKDEVSNMNKYVKEGSSKVNIKNGQAKVFLTLTDSSLITSFQVEDNGDFIETNLESKNVEADSRSVSFNVQDLDQILKGKVTVKVGEYVGNYDVRLEFDTNKIPTESKKKDENVGEKPVDPNEDNEDTKDEAGDGDAGDSIKVESTEPESLGEENEDIDKTEIEGLGIDEDETVIEDGVYTLSYSTEGANIGGSYEDTAILIQKNGKQYIQLQGKSMRQFVEYLYIDGKQMDLGPEINDAGAYFAQIELSKPLEENEFTFNMIINARGMLMDHETKITFDIDSLQEVSDDKFNLVEDTTKPIETNVVESNEKKTYSYTTKGANISRNYEDKVEIIEKDGKQYLQLNGSSMRQYVDALYIDGKSMVIGEAINESGAYKAQIELTKPVSDKNEFDFVMLINARGTVMMHKSTIIVDVEEEIFTLDYTTDGANISRSYEDTALLIKKGQRQYIQLQGSSMREYVEFLYIDGKQMDIGPPINDAGAYFTQFELTEPLAESKFDFVMVINARGMLMKHQTNITFDLDSLTEVNEENIDKYGLVGDTTEPIDRTTVDALEVKTYSYTTEGDDISRSYEETVDLIEKDGKQYLQLYGSSMQQFVDALYIDGKRMNIGEPINEAGAYIAQIELTEPLSEKNEFDFVMLINARGTIMMHNTNIIVDLDTEKETPEETGEEDKELEADEAYTIGYTILENGKDSPSIANQYFSGKAVLLKYGNEEYVQISTENDGGQYIKSFKNKIGDEFVEMVIVEEDGDDKTLQFKLDNVITSPVLLDMHIVVDDFYDATHEARLVFDTSTLEEANPEDYNLVASTNANGPNGEDAQDPGNEPDPVTDPKPDPKPVPKPNPSKPNNAIDVKEAYQVNYIIKKDEADEESVANGFFSGVAKVLHLANGEKYAQISTKDGGGKFIDSFRNQIGGKYQEMVVVEEKSNGDKVLQFKLTGLLSDIVNLDMVITVPGVYENEYHKARLFFDTTSIAESEPTGHYVIPSTNENGPDGDGAVTPETPGTPGETPGKDENLTKPGFGDGKGDNDGNAGGETTNPKTSDKTAIFLYAALLLAAATGLFFQLRRRFAKQ